MSKSVMLGEISARELHGPWSDFMGKLQTEEGRSWFSEFKRFLRQEPCWSTLVNRNIDCNAQPFVPKGWKIHRHATGEMIDWSKLRLSEPELLYVAPNQGDKKGQDVAKSLVGKQVMNACLLDWLLNHPKEIPEFWRDKSVFFWGTIYANENDSLCVRCLYWDGKKWRWSCGWLGLNWGGKYHPALLSRPLD